MSKDLEILKLKQMLEEAKIPFEFTDDLFRGFNKPSYKITINDKENLYLCDAIYHYGSYGYEKGLLEIMGALTDDERENDSVKGYLSANEVFKRFKYCYENNTDTYKDKKVESLQRLEAIENAKPSEALKNLESIALWSCDCDDVGNYNFEKEYSTIKQALLKAQEQEKENEKLLQALALFKQKLEDTDNIKVATIMMKQLDTNIRLEKENAEYKKVLDVIKNKEVDVKYLRDCKNLDEYNKYCDDSTDEKSLTQEEFDLLREYFK